MVNAQAFIDEDGSAWLYWGSDTRWGNTSRCWAVKLKADMITFDGDMRDITPPNYGGNPVMLKQQNRYYLTYTGASQASKESASDSSSGSGDYLHYAVGETPFGPFFPGSNSPFLLPEKAKHVPNPGHHAVFSSEGRSYILYHRSGLPFNFHSVVRRMSEDSLSLALPDDFAASGRADRSRPARYGPRPLSLADNRRSARHFAFAQ
ncbi:MAG TPA: family 43 glycosylhydrolase [Candidatus Methylacidiphilales bacterium]|nr:family 43 glycosylhydrolase [Candidatus Methylacidiphilales bacterium]